MHTHLYFHIYTLIYTYSSRPQSSGIYHISGCPFDGFEWSVYVHVRNQLPNHLIHIYMYTYSYMKKNSYAYRHTCIYTYIHLYV
jgi:hypothetical protein